MNVKPKTDTRYKRSNLATALNYARAGIPIFPIKQQWDAKAGKFTKSPAVADYSGEGSTTDVRRIEALWEQYPGAAVGLACAHVGALVVDCDRHNEDRDGVAYFQTLATEQGFDPATHPVIVETPSDGKHFYFTNSQTPFGNSAGEFKGKGVDIRGNGGLVVAPGSMTPDGREWRDVGAVPVLAACKADEVLGTNSLKPIPGWIAAKLKAVSTRKDRKSETYTDDQAEIAKAVAWLKQCPPALEGEGGNAHTKNVACVLHDHGISESVGLDLVAEHFNPRCEPEWDIDELATVVGNGYAYARDTAGNAIGKAFLIALDGSQFGAVDEEDGTPPPPKAEKPERTKHKAVLPLPAPLIATVDVPDRDWVVYPTLCGGNVSALVGPPGVSKSMIAIREAIAVASGRFDILDINDPAMCQRGSAWIHNQEDDDTEIDARIAAICAHFGIERSKLDGSEGFTLYRTSGVEHPLTLARASLKTGEMTQDPTIAATIAAMREAQIKMFVADPIVELHAGNENDPTVMRSVWGVARTIAKQVGCAVLLVAHSRKPSEASSDGHAGDMNTLRGSGAQAGVARMVRTVFTMSEKDASKYAFEGERSNYLRIDDAKNNLAPVRDYPSWSRRVSVKAGKTGKASVGVPESVQLGLASGVRDGSMSERDRETQGHADAVASAIRSAVGENRPMAALDALKAAGLEWLCPHAPNRMRQMRAVLFGDERASERNVSGGTLRLTARKGTSARLEVVPTPVGEEDEADLDARLTIH